MKTRKLIFSLSFLLLGAFNQLIAETPENKSNYIYFPSGCFEFNDACGNIVSGCWSCNYECSTREVSSAVAKFIVGYGCGNYDEQSYPQ